MTPVAIAIKSWAAAPRLFLTVTATFSLAIGFLAITLGLANRSVFSRLPYPDERQLYVVSSLNVRTGGPTATLSAATFLAAKAQPMVSAIGTHDSAQVRDSEIGETTVVQPVSLGFFATLKTRAMLGRTFAPTEHDSSAMAVCVLAYSSWHRLGLDPDVIGRVIRIGKGSATVVGVLPREFTFPGSLEEGEPQIYVPLSEAQLDAMPRVAAPIVRLQQGASPEQARAALSASSESLSIDHLRNYLYGSTAPLLWTLLAAAAIVMLLAVANLANLFAAHYVAKQSQNAVKCALGASRWHLSRDIALEAALPGAVGLVAGLGGAIAGYRLFLSLLPLHVVPAMDKGIDVRVAVLLTVLTAVSVLAIAAGPLIDARRTDSILRARITASQASPFKRRLIGTLVAVQIAAAVALMAGGYVLLRTVINLHVMNVGLDARNVVVLQPRLTEALYGSNAERTAYVEAVSDALLRVPGVSDVGTSVGVPTITRAALPLIAAGIPREAGADVWVASCGYFGAYRIAALEGRLPSASECRDGAPVAVLTRSAADLRLRGGYGAIGSTIVNVRDIPRTVIGVIPDVRRGLRSAGAPAMFIPLTRNESKGLVLSVRLSDRDRAGAAFGSARSVDGRVQMTMIRLDDRLARQIDAERLQAAIYSVFGAFAVLLVGVGVYGMVTHDIDSRRHEHGVRISMGATPAHLRQLVYLDGARLLIPGVLLGVMGAYWVVGLVTPLLFGVSPFETSTFAVPVLVATAATAAAVGIPAVRLSRVDPASLLKSAR